MPNYIGKHLKGYIIPFIILLVTILADVVFSPDSGLLKGAVSEDIHIQIDNSVTKNSQEEEESDSIYTLPTESPSLLTSWFNMLQNREYDSALLALDTLSITKAQMLKFKGITHYYMKRYGRADSLLVQSINLDSQDAESWYSSARVAFRQGKLTKAMKQCERALEIDSLISGAHFYKGRILLKEKKREAALLSLKSSLKIGYRKEECWYYMGIAYSALESDSAAFAFSEVIRYNPKSVKGRMRLAEYYTKQNDIQEVTSLYEHVLSIDRKHYSARLELLHAYLSQRDYHKASMHLALLKEQNPTSVDVLYEEAKLLGLQGHDKAALRIYHEIAKMDAKNPRVYYNMGVNLMDLGQKKRAVKAYKKALSINEYYWQAAYNLGVYYLKSGKLKSAQKYLSRSNSIQPEHVGSIYNLGLVTFKKGDYAGANKFFLRTLSISEEHFASRYNLALSYIKMEEYSKASAELDRLLEKKPKDEKVLLQKGMIALKSKKYDVAKEVFTQVVSLDSTSYTALYNLVLVHEKGGEYRQALKRVDELLSLHASSSKALLKKGELLQEMKATKSEIKKVTTLLESQKLSLSERADLATLMESSGQFKEAANQFYYVFKKKKTSANRLQYARLLVKSGNNKKGLKEFKTLYEKNSLDNSGLLQYAHALNESKMPVRATNILRELVEKNPRKSSYRDELATLYMSREKYSLAAKSYQRLYRLTKDLNFQKKQAFALLKADQYDNAEKVYKQIIAEAPQDWDALYQSALLAVRAGRSEEALNDWEYFIKVFPGDSRGYYQMGKLYFSLSRFTESKKLLLDSTVTGEHPHSHYYLAEIFNREGDLTGSKKHLEIYLSHYPTSKRGLKLKESIEG